jgi:hypothetical protein
MNNVFEGKHMDTNNNNFVTVIPKEVSKNRAKQNPLYFALSQPINLNISSDIKIKIQHVEEFNNQVYYIELQGKPTHHIYSGYAIDQRHLTIHKYFKEQNQNFNNGLSPAHYTEVYSSLDDSKQIVLHVYFDPQGFYKHIQIKQFEGKRQKSNFIELKVNSFIENNIRENSRDASCLLKTILYQKDRLYQSIIDSANQIEEELEIISLNFEKDSIENYIIKAKKYINMLQDADNYSNDIQDTRIKVMKQQIEFLTEKYNSLCREDTEKDETDSSLPEERTVINHKHNKMKEARKFSLNQLLINKSYEDILNKYRILTDLMHELEKSPSNIELLIKEYELIKEVQLKILTISSLITLDQKNYLQKIIKEFDLNRNINYLQKLFIDRFWEGDLESVQSIYLSTRHLCNFMKCVHGICIKLPEFKPDSEDHKEKFKATFDFLYRNSVYLRFHFNSQYVFLYFSTDEYTTKKSALVRASCNNNLFVFKLLLEYGINPNSFGMIIDDIQIPAIYPIASEAGSEFIQEAIKHGAHYFLGTETITMDNKLSKMIFPPSSTASARKLKYYEQELLKEYGINSEDLACKNLIEWLYKCNEISAIVYFIPQFTFEDLLYAFSLFAKRSEIMIRHLFISRATGFRVIHNRNERDKITANAIDPSKNLYSILFFTDQDNLSLDHIDKLANELKCKFEYLRVHEPDALKKIRDDLQKTNKQLSQLKAKSEKDVPWQFAAYLFLLVLENNPSVMTYQAIMQANCFEAAYYKNFSKKSLDLYRRSKTIAEISCYADQLQQTPLYQFICERVPPDENQNSPTTVPVKP